MKSIDDTLKIIRDITNAIPVKFDIALVGGAAVILNGVERTTLDVDLCIYSDAVSKADSSACYCYQPPLRRKLDGDFTCRGSPKT
jgi:hypothetical protein